MVHPDIIREEVLKLPYEKQQPEYQRRIVEEICGSVTTLSHAEWDARMKAMCEGCREKFTRLMHFYCHIAQPYVAKDDGFAIRDEVRLVAIASVIEALMSDEEYVEFKDWFAKKYRTLRQSEKPLPAFQTLVDEYHAVFGTTNKFKKFFERFLADDDRDLFKDRVIIYEEGGVSHSAEPSEISDFLYVRRSQFVHEARMMTLGNEATRSLMHYGRKKKIVSARVSVDDLMVAVQRVFAGWAAGYCQHARNAKSASKTN